MFIIVGTGGHSKVVCASLEESFFLNTQIRDDKILKSKKNFMGKSIHSPALPLDMNGVKLHVAIGDNFIREQILMLGIERGALEASVVHPLSSIHNIDMVAPGSFIACGAILSVDSSIEIGTIVNHNAVVDHDCKIGPFCHIAPGATIGGNVTIGKRVLVGSGATILPNITIEDDSIIGSGSVVTRSISKGTTWIANKEA
ncbi:NeuD/PglB/VioB family sugar acetyltransferase [Gammaproteobacteria bacterium]|nr:NeuD/PglB/VioB family sugar acetyltransferase [Gammaproteobacteria bacterium]MDA9101848.1 NeuD/PglB/VioB family sugar acetyltransferase [Gammaproteobacteria bacterium]